MPFFAQLGVTFRQGPGVVRSEHIFVRHMARAIGAATSLAVIDGRVPDMTRFLGALPPDLLPGAEGDIVGGPRCVFGRMPGCSDFWRDHA